MKDNWDTFTFSFDDVRIRQHKIVLEAALDKTKASTIELIKEGFGFA